jgi:hypothetical protein
MDAHACGEAPCPPRSRDVPLLLLRPQSPRECILGVFTLARQGECLAEAGPGGRIHQAFFDHEVQCLPRGALALVQASTPRERPGRHRAPRHLRGEVVGGGRVSGFFEVVLGLLVAPLLVERLREHGQVERANAGFAHPLELVATEAKLAFRSCAVACQHLDVTGDLGLTGDPGLQAHVGEGRPAAPEEVAGLVESTAETLDSPEEAQHDAFDREQLLGTCLGEELLESRLRLVDR